MSGKNKSVAVVVIGLILMVLYIYQGSPEFFDKYLSSLVPSGSDLSLIRRLYQFYSIFVLFGVIPVFMIAFVFKGRPRDFGLAIGDWRFGLKFSAIALVVVLPILFAASKISTLGYEYPLWEGAASSRNAFIGWGLAYIVYYISWEVFFRGFIQFGVRGLLGDWGAILLQTVASTLIHIGKPQGEIVAAIAAGVIFGWAAFRARSVLFLILLHWVIGVFTDFFCILSL